MKGWRTLILLFSFISSVFSSKCDQPGLIETYYNNANLVGPPVAQRIGRPETSWIVSQGYLPLPAGVPSNYFSVRWVGTLNFTQAGAYLFSPMHQDGIRIYLNGVIHCQYWATRPYTLGYGLCPNYFNVARPKVVPFVLEFYNGVGQEVMLLNWYTPSSPAQHISIPLENYCSDILRRPTLDTSSNTIDPSTNKATVSVWLTYAPTAPVTVRISSANGTYDFSACTLTFTSSNWNVPVQVDVFPVPGVAPIADFVEVTVISGPANYLGSKDWLQILPAPITLGTCHSVGDPHFKTFSGIFYDFYDVGDYYVVRDFDGDLVVQTRQKRCYYFSRPVACNFGVAIKYKSVVFYANVPQGTLTVSTSVVGNPQSEGVTIEYQDKNFIFSTPTGAKITIAVTLFIANGYDYLDVFVELPSSYKAKVGGLCGAYGQALTHLLPSNTFTTDPYAFLSSWLVPNANNLFLDAKAPIPKIGTSTPSTTPKGCTPRNKTTSDITDSITPDTKPPTHDEPPLTPVNPVVDCTVWTNTALKTAATTVCTNAFFTTIGNCCANKGVNRQALYNTCLCDYNLAGNDGFALSAIQSFTKQCEALGCNACPSNCNGKGTCTAGKCVCNTGYKGPSCGEDWNTPPSVVPAETIPVAKGCADITEVRITGRNFYGTDLKCSFGGTLVNAKKVSDYQVICPLPASFPASTANPQIVPVTVIRAGVSSAVAVNLNLYTSCCSNPCGTGATCIDNAAARTYTCENPCQVVVPPNVSLTKATGSGEITVSLTAVPTGTVTATFTTNCTFLSACSLSFTPANWNTPKSIKVFNSLYNTQSVTCVVNVETNAGTNCAKVKNAIPVTFPPLDYVTAEAWGDPHYLTFKGLRYDKMNTGNFTLVRDLSGEFYVQTTEGRCGDGTCQYGVAIKYKSTILYAYVTNSTVPYLRLRGNPAADGVTILKDVLTFITPTGIKVEVRPVFGASTSSYYLGIKVFVPPAYKGLIRGRLGLYDDTIQDANIPTGDVPPPTPKWSNNWAITDVSQNLFATPNAVITPLPGATPSPQVPTTSCSTYKNPDDISASLLASTLPELPLYSRQGVTRKRDNVINDNVDCSFANPQQEAAAQAACDGFFSSSELTSCCNGLGVDYTTYRDSCYCDFVLAGADFALSSALQFYSSCHTANLLTPSCNICPEGCHAQGSCNAGTCECDAGFKGVTCEENWNIPPSVKGLSLTSVKIPCTGDQTLVVLGDYFYGNNLACRFGSQEVPAVVNSQWQLACSVPNDVTGTVAVRVVRDGVVSTDSVSLTVIPSCCSTPCKNGGTCTDVAGGVTCQCPAGISGTLCTGATWTIVIKTSNRVSADSNGQMRLRLIGSLATLGPFVVANRPARGSTATFSTFVDTATFGDLWALELLNNRPNNGWIVETISVQTPSKTFPLGNLAGQMIRDRFTFEAPITVIAKTSSTNPSATTGTVYLGFRDAAGTSRTVPLGRSFAAGSTFTTEIPYVNLGAITGISLGINGGGWAFDYVTVVKRGVETTFRSDFMVTPKNSPLNLSP